MFFLIIDNHSLQGAFFFIVGERKANYRPKVKVLFRASKTLGIFTSVSILHPNSLLVLYRHAQNLQG